MSEREVDPQPVDHGEIDFDHEELRVFWDLARFHARLNTMPGYFGPTALESVPPPGWAFGESAEESDAYVARVLAEDGGSTTAPLVDYAGDLPQVGALSILCDGAGVPRALLEVTDVAEQDDEVVESFRVVHRS
ncbi:hypothetical protein KDN32_08590 [Nocardioides sp. J2M5]|uniref:hypothetical protein n=1 Tax=Nocardioides palaemonis TaxID=2829810 RepID=UPI001BADCCE7|nr:hypothetical protein [Nocardioides palaemonis]MBS2937800.1 hypothetical protein [Nocardioides palaemonis]